MQGDPVFHNLLVSAPNGGGLFALRNGSVWHVDGQSSTGIDVRNGALLRSLQPDGWRFYGRAAPALPDVPDLHDVRIVEDGFMAVGTQDNIILRFDRAGREIRRWVLPGEPDSAHVNCLACWQGRWVFSAFGDFDTHRGYKQGTRGLGFVRSLEDGQTLISGLSQPHSLTPWGKDLLLADSETQSLARYDRHGRLRRRVDLGGYTRGIAVGRSALFVGLSQSRNLGNDPVSDSASILALDPARWSVRARLPLPTREIYDIRFVSSDQAMALILARLEREAGR